MKKIDLAKQAIRSKSNIFMCPLCKKNMNVNASNSLTCINGHSFDLSKQGYINMLLGSVKTDYDKEMLESRNIICKSGFFDPMIQEVSSLMLKEAPGDSLQECIILDAGCGEGSHLAGTLANLRNETGITFEGVGIDISKEGIRIASRDYIYAIWCVADLSKMPFKDKQFDAILNILSPSNYSEFNRVLKDKGTLIKVVPGSEYLIELRRRFFNETDKQTYSNDKVIQHFSNNYNLIEKRRVLYNVILQDENVGHLLRMTPLLWNVKKEKVEKAISKGINNVTVDFYIVAGKKSIGN